MKIKGWTVFLALASASAHPLAAQATPKPTATATLVLHAPDRPFKPGAEARFKMVLTNTSDNDITFDLSDGFVIDIRDEKGSLAEETDAGAFRNHRQTPDGKPRLPNDIHFSGHLIFTTLKPGESEDYPYDVTSHYKPLPPGKYTVQATTGGYTPSTKTATGPIKSNVVALVIEP